jgi:hypothetical protein
MVNVNILSLNVDGVKESPSLDINSIPFDNPNLYVEFTQEDARPTNTISLVDVPSYKQLGTYTLNSHRTAQNIITNIYVKEDFSDIEIINYGKIPIKFKENAKLLHGIQGTLSKIPGQSVGYSKGGVFVKLRIEDKYILLLNLHLPVNTKRENMGYNYRKQSLLNIINQVSKYIDNDTMLLIGGDLNFRMNRSGVNQLTTLLNSTNMRLEELIIPEIDKKTFTCKFNSDSDRDCRLSPINRENENSFEKLSYNVQNRCGNSKRIPSRCDRFLIKSPYLLDVNRYTSLVLIDSSDHNAIFTSFNIDVHIQRNKFKRYTVKRKLNVSDLNGGKQRKTRRIRV